KTRDLTEKFDISVASFRWRFSDLILLNAEHQGEAHVLSAKLDGNEPIGLFSLHADDLITSGSTLFFTRMSYTSPNTIWRADVSDLKKDSEQTAVPHLNDALLSQIDMQPLESFTFNGANKAAVQGFMVTPRGLAATKKYPLKFL